MKKLVLCSLSFLATLLFAPLVHADPITAISAVNCTTPPNTPVAGNPYPVIMDPNDNLCVKAAITTTPSGTQDVNQKQVNGATINVGTGAAGTGTQRVTTSTDSTIGTVAAVTAITNALPAGSNLIGKTGIDQTTPGTTNNITVDGVVDPFTRQDTISSATFSSTINTAGYSSLDFQITANASANTVVWDCSDDNTNWSTGFITFRLTNQSGGSQNVSTTTQGANVHYALQFMCPYMRWRINTYVSGSTSLSIAMRRWPGPTGTTDVNVGNTVANAVVPQSSSTNAPLDSHCTVACASVNVSGAHNLYGFQESATVTGWILLEDATACAANGTVAPLRAWAYPTANVTMAVTYGDVPKHVTTGLSLCFSTTGPFTATTSTTAQIGVDYE